MTWPNVQNVHETAKACGRNKRRRPDAIAFRVRYGEEVIELTRRIQSGQYHPEPGVRFVTERPKNREIHAAHFRDRVVHHLLYDLLEPKFESCIAINLCAVLALEVPKRTGCVKPRSLAYFIEAVEETGIVPVIMEKRNEET